MLLIFSALVGIHIYFSCTLFNLYRKDLTDELNSIPGIKCLLYADDLVLWTEADKRKAEEKTEQILNKALATLEE